ncbi:hypothetical protein [Arenibaculum pallidiluteum]|uniref:hypothetical protein n=1 Tax=Arenibaculum pallidiluteum TaxID=2812559 RepID=UPI001A9725F4|nr:hypothetical protein [Arenibaculum pallidiluteum]
MALHVRIFAREEIVAGTAAGFDAVISVRGTSSRSPTRELDAAIAEAVLGEVDAMLVLRFGDIGLPAFGRQTGPADEHALAVLDFARSLGTRLPDARIAIHCEMGRSRSAAIALGIIADELGPERESEAVAELLGRDIEGHVAPNPLLVHLPDQRLWRYGALEAAPATASPAYVVARDHWAAVAAHPQGALQARTERGRRPRRNDFDQDVSGDWS